MVRVLSSPIRVNRITGKILELDRKRIEDRLDSKLRGRDLVARKVPDAPRGDQVATRAIVMQRRTKRPVQFERSRELPEKPYRP